MSTIPWRELALLGVTTIGVCCMIGWMTGAENLKKKKKVAQRGAPNGSSAESMEIEALMNKAEASFKKGSFSDVESAYLRVLEISSKSDDPQFELVPMYIHRRLVDVYEKGGRYEKAVRSLEIVIDCLAQKGSVESSAEDAHGMLLLLEKVVSLCFQAYGPGAPEAEKFLMLWLETATKIDKKEHIAMSATMLGKMKYEEDKVAEAEALFRRALTLYKHPADREELWMHCKTKQFDCLNRLENHEGAKTCAKEIADYLLNTADLVDKHNILESLGSRCLFLGYYAEAEDMLKSNLAVMKRKRSPPLEMASVDHDLASVWCATGRLQEARAKIREMKEYLRTELASSIFPSSSRYLSTQGVKHDVEGTTLALYRGKQGAGPSAPSTLKPGSVLVVQFENPDNEEAALPAVEYVVGDKDETIKILAPVNYSNYLGQLFSAEVSIYSDVTRAERLGTHFAFIPCTTAVHTPKPASSFPSSSSSSLRPGGVSQTITEEDMMNADPRELAVLQNMINQGMLRADAKDNPELEAIIRMVQLASEQQMRNGGGGGGGAGMAGGMRSGGGDEGRVFVEDDDDDDEEIEFDEDYNGEDDFDD